MGNRETANIRQFWPWWRKIMTGLNILALGLSIILSWHYIAGGSMIGCGGGSPCDQVLNSKWSVIAGIIPISGLAVGIYLALLVSGLFIGSGTEPSVRQLAWGTMLILAGSVAGSAIWFTILQKWFIGYFCPYCMTTHITGLLLSALIIWRALTEPGIQPDNDPMKSHKKSRTVSPGVTTPLFHPLRVISLFLTGLVIAGTLSGYQIAFTPSSVYSDGGSHNNLPEIDYRSAPVVGSPDADYVVTLLFDYQCSHCQRIHFMLDEAVQRYNGKLAFVLVPAPLNTQCNPYVTRDNDAFRHSCELARIGLAVWLGNREAFPGFENWMFTFESGDRWRPRSLETVIAKAIELIGKSKFDAALSDPWIESYMKSCVQIYGRTIESGKGGIPKLVFGSRWVIPEPQNADELISMMQNSLALPLP